MAMSIIGFTEILYHKRATLLYRSPHELLPALYLGHVCIQGRIGLVSSGTHIVVIGHGLQRDRPIALWKPDEFFPGLHLSSNCLQGRIGLIFAGTHIVV